MLTFSDKYGFFIVLTTIIVRIFVVSIAWNYGIFILALKKSFPNSKLLELEWIAGLAQGLGSLLAPVYLIIINRFGARISFTVGMILSCISLFLTSFVTTEHVLFFTYSIPFGVGSSLTMFVGTMLTGQYFPPDNKFHILSTVLISLGFPLGFLVLNPLTEVLLETHGWHFAKRLYSLITLICIGIFCPFFTDKYTPDNSNSESVQLIPDVRNEEIYYPSRKIQIFVNIVWFVGLVIFGLAVNSVIINLNGYYESLGITPIRAANLMMLLGGADALYRLILSLVGYFFKNLLLLFYIMSALIGAMLTIFWPNIISYGLNALLAIAFGLALAVFMSLQYPVSTEINGPVNIKKTYTVNVMTSGVGVIIGPTISGALLDASQRNYKTVFQLSSACFITSMLLFSSAKLMLIFIKSRRNNQHESLNNET